MSTKTYRVRFTNVDKHLAESLDLTHMVFVKCLAQMVERYLQMKKGKFGSECSQLIDILLQKSNTFAHGLMDQLTRKEFTSQVDQEWSRIAKRVHQQNGPLFLQHKGFATIDGVIIHTKPQGRFDPISGELAVEAKFWHQVCDSASAFLKSNQELMEQWRENRRKWLEEKFTWENNHPDFVKFWNGPYKEFQEICEQLRIDSQSAKNQKVIFQKNEKRGKGKRFDRWHLWYEWIVSHPNIIGWRGKATVADFKTIPEDVQANLKGKSPRKDKYISKYLDWLKKNNPELNELDKIRREYIQKYLKFDKPPTLTLPSPQKHPYWFTLELNQFYKNVDFEKGTIQIKLIDKDKTTGAWKFQWINAQIQCDPRLKPSYRAQRFVTTGEYPPYIEGKVGQTLSKPAADANSRKAGIAGAKLVIKGNRRELLFTVIEQNMSPKIKFCKVKDRTCPADHVFAPNGEERIPVKIMAVDLGIRHIGAYALARGVLVDSFWSVNWEKKGIISDSTIPSLRSIRSHDQVLRRLRSRSGAIPRGERSHITLQDHKTNSAVDRFKKASNLILEIARKHDVHLILFEDLDKLLPSAFDERWVNRQLRDMNRSKIIESVRQKALDFGIYCDDGIRPYLTSHMCSKCFKPGWRFSMKSKPCRKVSDHSDDHDYGYPIWDEGGHLFTCPHCGNKTNADINASGNLILKFFGKGLWNFRLKRKDYVYTWMEGETLNSFDARMTFQVWAQAVKNRKESQELPF